MCGLVIAASAAAQTSTFDIPEGDLKVALEAYARQSGVRLVYLSEDVRDRRTSGARGDMSQDAALNRLLAGTGLTVKRDQSGALAIVREAANAPAPSTRSTPSSSLGQAGSDTYTSTVSGGADASTTSTTAPTTFDAVQVTGSHIKRAQMSGVGPTTVIDAETIQSSGAVSVETLLQRLPASAGAAGSQSNNFWTGNGNGTTQINLRGLGVNRTLVLLNGRRVVNGGTGANNSVDLNVVPLALVDRIEILKDGASAIYGADAVAGVVNIITRKEMDGVELSTRYGQTFKGDGEIGFRHHRRAQFDVRCADLCRKWHHHHGLARAVPARRSGGHAAVRGQLIHHRRSCTLGRWPGSQLQSGSQWRSALLRALRSRQAQLQLQPAAQCRQPDKAHWS